jgi:hypothetical protein
MGGEAMIPYLARLLEMTMKNTWCDPKVFRVVVLRVLCIKSNG